MRGFRALVTSLVCGLALTAPAAAADMPGTWLPDLKKQLYTDLISGWYIRGDLGYRKGKIGSVDSPTPTTAYSLEDAWTFGGGAGYKYKWFRSDVTLDYANAARYRGDTAATPEYYRGKIDSFTLLANVYLDMGTWAGFTPYIGVGAGTTNLRIRQYENISMVPTDGLADTTRWNLTWAYMGGISYRVSPSMLIDVSYRYLNLGEASSGTEPPANTSRTYFRDMTAQEVRVGLRWMLD